MVGGLELATLVFMDLKVTPGGPVQIKGESYSKMDNYIVDTGYGLERFVWASKGTPTIYDAIFPDLVRKVADLAGVEHNLSGPGVRRDLRPERPSGGNGGPGRFQHEGDEGEDRQEHRNTP